MIPVRAPIDRPLPNHPLVRSPKSDDVSIKVNNFALQKFALVAIAALAAAAFFGVKIAIATGVISTIVAFVTSYNFGASPLETGGNIARVERNPQAPRPVEDRAAYYLREFARAGGDFRRVRALNVEVFEETRAAVRGVFDLQGHRVELDPELQDEMVNGVYRKETAPVGEISDEKIFHNIRVVPGTTKAAVREMCQRGLNPLVMNMANAEVPGGGVIGGAGAQEETLCRQSNLYRALIQAKLRGLYPLPEKGGLLVPQVQFFRGDRDEGYCFEEPVAADVFTVAAYNCNPRMIVDRPVNDEEYREGMKGKIRSMMITAVEKNNDSLLFSAFGCGAFANDPEIVASLFNEVFQEEAFVGKFKEITFGIYDPPGVREPNFPIFREALAP